MRKKASGTSEYTKAMMGAMALMVMNPLIGESLFPASVNKVLNPEKGKCKECGEEIFISHNKDTYCTKCFRKLFLNK